MFDSLKRMVGNLTRVKEFAAVAMTDRGLARKDNQDAYLSRPDCFFFCVADGMGGGQGGALASKWVCEAFAVLCDSRETRSYDTRLSLTDDTLQQANQRIRSYARENGFKMMGCTVVGLVVDPDDHSRGSVFHVGDSRIYRLRSKVLESLTRDHTVGNELGQALSRTSDPQAMALKSRRNPLAHVLTRAVGTEYKVREEWQTIDIKLGDRFLLCSDGVHDMLSDDEIAGFLRAAKTPREAMRSLSEAVMRAGAGDNYTILCVFAGRG